MTNRLRFFGREGARDFCDGVFVEDVVGLGAVPAFQLGEADGVGAAFEAEAGRGVERVGEDDEGLNAGADALFSQFGRGGFGGEAGLGEGVGNEALFLGVAGSPLPGAQTAGELNKKKLESYKSCTKAMSEVDDESKSSIQQMLKDLVATGLDVIWGKKDDQSDKDDEKNDKK